MEVISCLQSLIDNSDNIKKPDEDLDVENRAEKPDTLEASNEFFYASENLGQEI